MCYFEIEISLGNCDPENNNCKKYTLRREKTPIGKRLSPTGEKEHYYHYRWEAKAKRKMYKPFFVKITLL